MNGQTCMSQFHIKSFITYFVTIHIQVSELSSFVFVCLFVFWNGLTEQHITHSVAQFSNSLQPSVIVTLVLGLQAQTVTPGSVFGILKCGSSVFEKYALQCIKKNHGILHGLLSRYLQIINTSIVTKQFGQEILFEHSKATMLQMLLKCPRQD